MDKAYTDLTGRFPVQSSCGNNYVLVCYSYDGNAILAEPLKNISTPKIVKAWAKVSNTLELADIQQSIYILDNEISNEFKTRLKNKDIKFQLVPPHIHRRNAAERDVQSFKNHLLAGLASYNNQFSSREWDRLILQEQTTLNLLRNARINPKLSAYAYVFGNYDFNKYPLAPPGTHAVVHANPNDRACLMAPLLLFTTLCLANIKIYLEKTKGIFELKIHLWGALLWPLKNSTQG